MGDRPRLRRVPAQAVRRRRAVRRDRPHSQIVRRPQGESCRRALIHAGPPLDRAPTYNLVNRRRPTLVPYADTMSPDEFRRIGHRLIDWIADYRAGVAGRPVAAGTQPGEVKAQLPASPPEQPESFDAVFRDLER